MNVLTAPVGLRVLLPLVLAIPSWGCSEAGEQGDQNAGGRAAVSGAPSTAGVNASSGARGGTTATGTAGSSGGATYPGKPCWELRPGGAEPVLCAAAEVSGQGYVEYFDREKGYRAGSATGFALHMGGGGSARSSASVLTDNATSGLAVARDGLIFVGGEGDLRARFVKFFKTGPAGYRLLSDAYTNEELLALQMQDPTAPNDVLVSFYHMGNAYFSNEAEQGDSQFDFVSVEVEGTRVYVKATFACRVACGIGNCGSDVLELTHGSLSAYFDPPDF